MTNNRIIGKVCVMRSWILVLLLTIFTTNFLFSQNCGPGVPSIVVDLSASPDTTWISPYVQRNDNCCGTSSPDKCVEFIITLNPGSQGINFDIYSGAIPTGSMFYQINCGPPIAVGEPVCLNGVGPHVLTFCKPGNNQNQYAITSIPDPSVSPNIILNDGCIGSIITTGLNPASISYNSIYPGNYGAYNSYLSCPVGCEMSQVTAQAGYPPYVLYQVCGLLLGACSTTPWCDTVQITFNPTLYAQIQPNPATLCYGQSSMTLTASGLGGTPPYTYTWSTGQTSQSINVGVGTYTVIIHDATNCPPATTSINVTSYPSPIQANAGSDQQICSTMGSVQLNGSVVAATGGVWSGGQGSFVPSNAVLNPTYYPSTNEIINGYVNLVLTTTGNGTCPPDIDSVHISFLPFMGTAQILTQPASCYLFSNGNVSVSINGGNGPYSYMWNTQPPATTSLVNNLPAGSYTVTITDALGCTLVQTATVSQPADLQSLCSFGQPSCYGGDNGTGTVTIIGGTPGYSVQWSNGATGTNVSNLSVGTYTYTVTDARGCTKVNTVTVTQPDSISVQIQTTNPVCYQGSTGSILLTVTGGTAPYSYTWNPSNYTGSFLQNMPAGIYQVTVTDNKGCTLTETIILTQPADITSTSTFSNPSCYGAFNGQATVTPSGGTPPYFYVWSPYGGSQATANGLGAGTFSVSVYDANGCSDVNFITLTQPPPLQSLTNWINNVSCYGGGDGSASISVSGGTPPYSYLWQPSGGTSSIGQPLSAGNYIVSITDTAGCVIQQNITIQQPVSALAVLLTSTNVSCSGGSNGSIIATALGGTQPYTYSWLPSLSTTSTLNNVPAGIYQITVTDYKGCTTTASVNIAAPGAIVISTTATPSVCGGSTGSAVAIVSGGNLPYSYLWNPGGATTSSLGNLHSGIYTLTVTDAASCTSTASVLINDIGAPSLAISEIQNVSCFGGNDGSVTVTPTGGAPPYTYTWYPYGGIDSTATGLSAGIFYVTVTDSNGCIATQLTDPPITQPSAIMLITNKTNASCYGSSNGSASVSASGGTAPYTYLWQPGGTTLPGVTNLPPGIYSVTVTDSHGCTENAFITIEEPLVLSVIATGQHNISCYNGNDGSITLQASGGTSPYNYLWSPSNYTSSQVSNLSSGTHTCYITDAHGCATSISVTLIQPTPLSLFIVKTNVVCYEGDEGTATALCSGGVPPYSYQWSPTGGTTQSVSNLEAGFHFLTVTDSLGCSLSNFIEVSEPLPLIPAILLEEDVSCFGGNDGYILLGANGGTPPYSYLWSGSETTPYLSNLTVGTYYCTITDGNGCTSVVTSNIYEPSQPLQISTTASPVNCYHSSDGIVSVNATGGTPPYTYLWVPTGSTNSTVPTLPARTYTVTVFDINQCLASTHVDVTEPPEMAGNVQTIQHVNCYAEATGSLTANIQGGSPPYSFQWNTLPQQTTQTAVQVFAGQYNVTVYDSHGCGWTEYGIVNQPPPLQSVTAGSPPSCYMGNNGQVWVAVSGGSPPYSYFWNTMPVQTTLIATSLTAGSYQVTITDNNGCTIIDDCSITQPTQVIAITEDSITICKGESILLTVSATGGTGSYQYYWNNYHFGPYLWVTPVASTQYTVFAFDSLGCVGIPDTCVVIVKEFIPADVNLYATSPICPGNSSLIYVTAQVSQYDTLYYTWSNGLGPGPGAFVVVPTATTTYFVTVSNTCHVNVIDHVTVTFKPLPVINFNTDHSQGCLPLTINFTDSSTTTYDNICIWRWDFGDGTYSTEQNPSHIYNYEGTYQASLEVETDGGCTNNNTSSPLVINVFPNPTADFLTNKDVYFLPNDPVICINNSSGAIAYEWNFGDGTMSTQENPSHSYDVLGTYPIILVAFNEHNCTDTAIRIIVVSGDILFPNVFTPNPDLPPGGYYDINNYSNYVFFPISTGVDEFKMQIFNRWGELIFETDDIAFGWDGYYREKLCEQDVYVYKATVRFIDGRIVEKIGDVLLLR